MKFLKQIFLMTAIAISVSIAASAQDKEQKPRPPKDPPVINPGDKPKPPKENQPKNEDRNKDNRGKKPEMSFNEITNTISIEFV
ncbi:MAG: hypothetical protein ACR2IA_01675 [Pyrinomonadaceae bacterium]